MSTPVDARKLACPQPVILTRRALQNDSEVVTIVDNETARHNVTRMAERQGYHVHTDERADGIYMSISRDAVEAGPSPAVQLAEAAPGAPLVLLVSSEHMGRGEHEELGLVLMRAFFHTLGEVEPLPSTVIFLNSGVKLTIVGSPIIDDLEALSSKGVELLTCGTCLDYYGIGDQLAVGEVSNMYSIAEAMLGAGNLVTL